MGITQNAAERVARAVKKINQVLEEEQCTMEPSVVVVSGKLVETELNVIAKILVPEKVQEAPAAEPAAEQPAQPQEGEAN